VKRSGCSAVPHEVSLSLLAIAGRQSSPRTESF
jgi:hypothetical protein